MNHLTNPRVLYAEVNSLRNTVNGLIKVVRALSAQVASLTAAVNDGTSGESSGGTIETPSEDLDEVLVQLENLNDKWSDMC